MAASVPHVPLCRQCDCRVGEDEMDVCCGCVAYGHLRVKYGSDLGFQRCELHTLMDEASLKP